MVKMLLQLLPKCATWLNSVNDQTTSLGASAAGGGTLEGDPIIGPFVEWFHLEADSLQCSLSASSRPPREWLADSGKEGSARKPLTNRQRLLSGRPGAEPKCHGTTSIFDFFAPTYYILISEAFLIL